MVKRGSSRFDPLPTSDDSDPALLSHRAIEGSSGGGGGPGWPIAPNGSDRLMGQNGLDNSPSFSPKDDESHRLAVVSQPVIKRLNGGSDAVHPATNMDVDGEEDEDEELLCGLGPCFSPAWLQPLASKQMFLAVFCLACVLQGMFYTYFVSVLTTIEKLFQIQSKTTGIIMSATEIGQIGGALLLTYYGGQGHRPKWIGWGMVLFGASAALCSLPHFLFWRTKPNTGSSSSLSSMLSPDLQSGLSLVAPMDPSRLSGPQKLEMDLICRQVENANLSLGPQISELERNEQCAKSSKQQAISRTTTVVLAFFFLSLLGIGMGRTAVETLGIPYMDDNVANRESPTYFAINIGVKILGPVFGFVLGSLCTSIYVDPLVEPDVTPKDPRWIGAWWLGMIFVASTILLASFSMFAFPRRLPRKGKRTGQHKKQVNGKIASPEAKPKVQQVSAMRSKNPSLKDFPKAIRRLLKNDILLFRTASSVLHILPVAGLYTFLPKYLESQFRMTAHSANMISGIGGIGVMGIGIFFSGVFIRLRKPSPKFVAAWIALTALLYAIGMALLMLLGCPMSDFSGLEQTDSGMTIKIPCNRTCECDSSVFAPICTSTGETYFSACHAGCANLTHVGGQVGSTEYSNCECLDVGVTATSGYCHLECNNYIWYIGIFSLFVLIHSTSEVGSMLLTLRCVHAKDKAMALGLIQFAIGLFANVPCPIIYGAVVDSACFVWEKTCGEQGACWLYDAKTFRVSFHGTTGALMLCAFFVDLVVWYKADKITFPEDETPPCVEMEQLAPSAPLAVQYESTL
ncbi:solute carrier organic anion transporter family member 74D-like isoform X2 [Daphnia carinata]|nr:solute carrier organic anion transporter family member 74D-like isoform X2 [Daphnia carinata]XP_059351056.1 solute carrier organic anion transporter family member 74D-like isoform X2 [Daphnia carinata]XP_059351057.1 solute carrier organic anion transporter family member 74D-like isoform X2 [Daphnia carinata]XP_059351058.1 solute carrier organic anion transporter family member 74D-like isoform X2 [Daphnia carinata]